MRIEPPLAAAPPSRGGKAVRGNPRKPLGDLGRLEQQRIRTEAALELHVLLQRATSLLRGHDQVAALAETYVGLRSELLPDALEEADAKLRKPDVLRRRELLPDRRQRAARGAILVARILLDHDDGAFEAVPLQKVGDRAADHGTADDYDICLRNGHYI